MTLDDQFDIRDLFQEAFCKLVAEHLDKCDSQEALLDVQYMLQDCTSVFGCAWEKYSKKFNPTCAGTDGTGEAEKHHEPSP
jgi:hypothetical protein